MPIPSPGESWVTMGSLDILKEKKISTKMESPTNVANYVKGEMLIEAKMLEAKADAEAKQLSRNIMLKFFHYSMFRK